MRLLIVTNDYPPKPGGIQMYLGSLVDAYPDAVHVVAPYDRDAEPNESGEPLPRPEELSERDSRRERRRRDRSGK